MRVSHLEDLLAVAETAYQIDLSRLHAITAEEAEIQAELTALIDEIARADAQDALAAMPLRHIGGDVLWRGWVGRKRAQLNIRLAATIASKQQALAKLKHSFGKKKSLEDLRDRERLRLNRRNDERRLQNDQEQMIAAAVGTKSASDFL